MIIKEALNRAKKELRNAKIAEPESSAEFLMRLVLGIERSELYSSLEKELTKKEQRKFNGFIKKKAKTYARWANYRFG